MIKEKRNSNIELLRIICMLIIIIHHAILYSGALGISNNIINQLVTSTLYIGGKLGANCFFAISSYFLIKNQGNNIKKALKVHNIMIFYSILFLILNYIFKFRSIVTLDYFETFLPFFYNSYWFITSYILLLLLYPYFNIIINNINKSEHKKILILLLILVTIPGTFLINSSVFISSTHFMLTILIYFLVAYICKYCDELVTKEKSIMIFIIDILVPITFALLAILIGNIYKNDFLITHATILMNGESIFIIIAAIALLMIAIKSKNRNSEWINLIALSTIDIYLIHMNHFIYKWIWNDLFKLQNYFDSKSLIIVILVTSTIVLVVSDIIGLIRINICKIFAKINNRIFKLQKS